MRSIRPLLPWVVWLTAALAYGMAIINRSSLAALGPAAQEHFSIDATALAAFPVIQLIVYAGFQIPVGMLLDRFGVSIMIVTGGILMALGQVTMALVPDVGLAIIARVLVGAGDACTFISVMRLIPEWFSVRQLPTVGQLTGLIGQSGQLLSVTPLALFIGAAGWAGGFVGVAAVGLLFAILSALVLRDAPGIGTLAERMTGRMGRLSRNARSLNGPGNTQAIDVAPPVTSMIPVVKSASKLPGAGFFEKFRRLWKLPGVRLAFWVHFTSPFAANVFLFLWGTPFLTGGVGLNLSAAGGLLSIMIGASMFAGFVLGPLSSRFIERRVWINFGITAAIAVVWIMVILWPGTTPMWLLIGLMVIVPLGGPASMIAFEVLRSHTPQSFSGFATGFVNMAGFTASLVVLFLVGILLDLQGAGSPENYSLGAFKIAFSVQIPVWALGLVMIVVEMRRTGRWMSEHGRRLR